MSHWSRVVAAAILSAVTVTVHGAVLTGTFNNLLDGERMGLVFGEGTNLLSTTTTWSVAASGSGYLSDFGERGQVAALPGVTDISQVTDAGSYSFGSGTGLILEGQFVAAQYPLDNRFAVVRFDEIVCPDNCDDPGLATLDATWWLQTDGSGDFSSFTVTPTPGEESPGGASLQLFSGLNSSAPLTIDNFDSSLPTILVTHGWQNGADQAYGDGSLPRQDTVNDVLARLNEESIDANVVLYNWEGAYTTVAQESYQETHNAGVNLGTQLSSILGSDYENSLHMIGHSHGTGVNGFAVELLQRQGISVDLFTILDSPMDITSDVFTNADFSRDFFAATLDGDAVGYVENYWSSLIDGFGKEVDGANNKLLTANHSQVAAEYGSQIIRHDQIFGPFGKNDYRTQDWPWRTPERNNLSDLMRWEGQPLQVREANFNDWATLFGTSEEVLCGELAGDGACSYSDVYRSLVESSPSAISTELVIPNDVTALMFDYVFGDIGDGDWISLYLEDELLWELSGLSISSGLVGTAFLDIGDFLGTTGELTFLLNSVGASNLEFAFANLRFVSSPSSVPLPPTIFLLLLGTSILLKRRNSYRFC